MTNGETVEIEFGEPFKTIDFCDELRASLPQFELPPVEEWHTETAAGVFRKCAQNAGIELTKECTNAHMIDKLFAKLVESKCIQPTFICNHPMVC